MSGIKEFLKKLLTLEEEEGEHPSSPSGESSDLEEQITPSESENKIRTRGRFIPPGFRK